MKAVCRTNGFEIRCDLSQELSIVQVYGYDEVKTPQLLTGLSDWLSRMPMGIPIADVWSCGEPIAWIRQSARVRPLSKNRCLYVLPSASSFSDAREDWFDTRCTLLGVCPSEEALSAYAAHRGWAPGKALRRGGLSAYLCADAANDGCVVGVRGRGDALLNDVTALLR